MLESLFGAEMPLALRFFIVFLIVLGLIGMTAWVVRRFGVERSAPSPTRSRYVRLAVIEDVEIHGRRRLVLIRRDNVEHLLMIGGPSDVVVEPNIVRAATVREAAPPARPPAAADALPRPAQTDGTWPLQPEPAAQRPPRIPTPIAPLQDSIPWRAEPELRASPTPPPVPRRRALDPLAGLAPELSRSPEGARAPAPADLGAAAFMPREPARRREPARERDGQPEREPRARAVMRPREPMRESQVSQEREPLLREREAHEPMPARVRELMREREPTREAEREAPLEREPVRIEGEVAQPSEPAPVPSEAEPKLEGSADQNLTDKEQRPDTAQRRPARADDPSPADTAAPPVTGELEAANGPAPARPVPPAAPSPPRAEPKAAKSVYESLEKEMASLLGNSSGKS